MIFRFLCVLSVLVAFGPAGAETVQLRSKDLVRVGLFGWIVPKLKLPKRAETLPTVLPDAQGAAAGLLKRLAVRGQAAGLDGVLYDNRDRAHSMLPTELFPQITPLDYSPELREGGLDYGLAGEILFPVPTLGNSSTAVTHGDAPRSLTRLAMTTPLSPARMFRSYTANHLYVYPEHRDHDEIDWFPANWPYTVTSQGSSGSDQPFLRSLIMTLAAFSPETRARLENENLISPTLQMILRRTQKGMYGIDAYKSSAAHPTVFALEKLSPDRMVALAASIKPEDIPPMVRMKVLSEDFGPKADLAGMTEQLFTTPSAIARVWRGLEYKKNITLSVEDTKDPNGRELDFFWVLLRGDAKKTKIVPTKDGKQATIELMWHSQLPINPGQARMTSRVDIGVIAWNGVHFSAPAFLSVSFPTHQDRVYALFDDGVIRLQMIDYDAQARNVPYDPLLHWSATWRDIAVPNPGTRFPSWSRHATNGEIIRLDPKRALTGTKAINYQMDGILGEPRLSYKVISGSENHKD